MAALCALVHVFVHVPLAVPHALPGVRGPWYCSPGMAHVDTPIAAARLASYERRLRAYGQVVDHVGFGTWTVGADPRADVAFEDDDHVEIVTSARAAAVFLRPFLREMRAELVQREALGEIVGVENAAVGEPRTRIVVRLAPERPDATTLRTIYRIFGNRGNGGASAFRDADGTVVYSGVAHDDVPRIEAELHRAGVSYATEPETFVTVDAPRC